MSSSLKDYLYFFLEKIKDDIVDSQLSIHLSKGSEWIVILAGFGITEL